MGRIVKSIALNPVEPAPLSFRAPLSMQTILDLSIFDATGKPINEDLAGQLQLISRTTGRTVSFAAPASDIANGKVRVVFDQGALQDRNGYRLRFFGTIKGIAELIATGIVYLTATQGPTTMLDDVIDQIPLIFTRGQDAVIDIGLWIDQGKETPYDLTTVTVTSAVYPDRDNAVPLYPFTQQITGPNTLRLTLAAALVDTLPDACWWNLRVSSSGQVKTLAEGPVSVVVPPDIITLHPEGTP